MTFVNSAIEPAEQAFVPQQVLEREVASLIVETLQLDIDPAAIAPCEALFSEGLGLDSIDGLEMALAISKRYGMELKSDDARRGEIFANLRSLSACIASLRTR